MKGKVLVSATVILLALAMVPMARADETTVNPSDDCTVFSPDPGNWDTKLLHARADSSFVGRSYLKFDVSGLAGRDICGAELWLYCDAATVPPDFMDVDVHETGDGWVEETIVWGTAPAVGGLLATLSVDGANAWYMWTSAAMKTYVANQIAGDGKASFVVKLKTEDTTKDPIYHRNFEDKEHTHVPYLKVILVPQCVPEFGANVMMITSVAAALMFTLKRLRK